MEGRKFVQGEWEKPEPTPAQDKCIALISATATEETGYVPARDLISALHDMIDHDQTHELSAGGSPHTELWSTLDKLCEDGYVVSIRSGFMLTALGRARAAELAEPGADETPDTRPTT